MVLKNRYICTRLKKDDAECNGEMAEWSIAAVLKTVEV